MNGNRGGKVANRRQHVQNELVSSTVTRILIRKQAILGAGSPGHGLVWYSFCSLLSLQQRGVWPRGGFGESQNTKIVLFLGLRELGALNLGST